MLTAMNAAMVARWRGIDPFVRSCTGGLARAPPRVGSFRGARNLQVGEALRDVPPRRLGIHLAVDVEDAAVLADVEGVAVGVPLLHEDAVGSGGLFRGVAQDRVVEAEGFGELAVGLGVIGGGGEVGDVVSLDLGAAGT